MNILFLRHGQSEDDLIDAFGGWADWELTAEGARQLEISAEKIAALELKFDKLLTSPLKRAVSGAEIVGRKLGLNHEVFEYVKERNTYGIMCGMLKADAELKYPWLYAAYKNDEYVDGSERVEDVAKRVQKAFALIKAMPVENVIVVTHGMFLKALVETVLKKKLTKKEDGGFIMLHVEGGSISVVKQEGIEID